MSERFFQVQIPAYGIDECVKATDFRDAGARFLPRIAGAVRPLPVEIETFVSILTSDNIVRRVTTWRIAA